MKYQMDKTNDFEKLVRKMTCVVKQNTNYDDDDIGGKKNFLTSDDIKLPNKEIGI